METNQTANRDRIWTDVIKNATGSAVKDVAPLPSIREVARKGWSFKAIQEAHDGEIAMKKKSQRLGRLLGVTYLLITEAIQLVDESELMMDRSFRQSHDFKRGVKLMNNGFDMFYHSVRDHISPQEMARFKDDLQCFDTNVRSWANLEGYKVSTKEDEKTSCHDRIVNLHKEFISKLFDYKDLCGEDGCKAIMKELKELDDIEAKNMTI